MLVLTKRFLRPIKLSSLTKQLGQMKEYYYNYSHDYAPHLTLMMMVLGGAGAFLVYGLGLAIYRLCFSPIAGFPGPKLAALPLWYEFYYDVVRGGRYWAKINELHDRYGELP